jgi:hypothetical protein
MRCPYCHENIRVQGRFCPKCGQQLFGLPVQPSGAPATPPPPTTPPLGPPPAPPPAHRPPDLAGDDLVELLPDDRPLKGPAAPPTRTIVGAHPATGEEIGKTCPYCRFPVKPGEQVLVCPACKVIHHADCYAENQGCTTYGCRGSATAAPPQSAAPTPTVLPPGGRMPIPDLASLQGRELEGRASNALIYAILGMFCCALLSLVGLFMGLSVLGDIKRLGGNFPSAKGKAVGAVVCGCLATAGWLIYLFVLAAQNQ